jgi:hypothetical protein
MKINAVVLWLKSAIKIFVLALAFGLQMRGKDNNRNEGELSTLEKQRYSRVLPQLF